ncbi:MAG: hypothetical protein QNJ67_06195 [Kiloniellales bacterium]|nr:hypothetical protein [Kiloniellales bacterium]
MSDGSKGEDILEIGRGQLDALRAETEELLETERGQVEALRAETQGFLNRRVTFWGLRWSLGFAVIWAVVSYEPAWHWLWWAGAALAAVSLAALVLGHVVLTRKLKKADLAIDRAREIARSLDEGTP